MAVREIVRIDEELCDGCGDCVPACAEGAIAIVDGTARLVDDVTCDGLGACLGHCPQGAITIDRREAEAFDPEAVRHRLAQAGRPFVAIEPPGTPAPVPSGWGGCPGSRATLLDVGEDPPLPTDARSRLRHWPVQLHLVPPTAPFFRDASVLLAADCVAYACAAFHERLLAGRSLAIACPKLDSAQEAYIDKLVAMFDVGGARDLIVAVMEVPCCSGLVQLVREAQRRAERSVPTRVIVIGTRGEIVGEQELRVTGVEHAGVQV